jgi:hypothetical protein
MRYFRGRCGMCGPNPPSGSSQANCQSDSPHVKAVLGSQFGPHDNFDKQPLKWIIPSSPRCRSLRYHSNLLDKPCNNFRYQNDNERAFH